jgi:hypothetical protein
MSVDRVRACRNRVYEHTRLEPGTLQVHVYVVTATISWCVS